MTIWFIISLYAGVLDEIEVYTDEEVAEAAFIKNQWRLLDLPVRLAPPDEEEWQEFMAASIHSLWLAESKVV